MSPTTAPGEAPEPTPPLCGDIPPAEHETLYYRQNTDADITASAEHGLH